MVKAFATSAFALVALFGLVVVACSDSSDSTFTGDPPKPDAEDGPISSLVPDGGGPDAGEAGPGSCTAALPSPFTPVWKVPARSAAACSTDEITAYYNACLFNAGTTEKDGTCAKWKTDHPTCGACAEPDDRSGPLQWQASRKFYTLNVAGCIALKQEGTDAGSSCGEAYNAFVDCGRQACISCITEANSFPLFSQCQAEQKTKGCMPYDTAKVAACGNYPGAAACFPTATEGMEIKATGLSETFYERIVAVTCGP